MDTSTTYQKTGSHEAKKGEFDTCLLLYSGGLDTSVMLKWIQEQYDADVIALTIDIGQLHEDLEEARLKALTLGAKEAHIVDAKDRFADELLTKAVKANADYQGNYHLSCPLGRVIISQIAVEKAQETGATVIAHGCTGKGNDQVRFELGAYALAPGIQVIAPWREWDLNSREKLMKYCEQNNIPVDFAGQKKKSPYSMDANLLHISYEGGNLEDPYWEPEEDMWRWSVSPEAAPDVPTYIELGYQNGDPVTLDGNALSPAVMLETLNKVAGANGIGRLDLVENRYVGMKSRGCYETPGGTVLLRAHRAIESITLDREVAHLKDELMPRYAKLIYNGYWWSPERRMLQAAIDESQAFVNGVVRLKLYKGNVVVVGRKSENSLFDEAIATFEDDAGAYNQKDAEGFIKLNALRMRIAANKGRSQL